MLSIRFAMAAQSAIIVALLFCLASVWAAPPVLRGTKSSNATNVTAAQGAVRSFRSFRSSWQHAGCCNSCHTAFCSPQSGSCYDYKGKYYYLECQSGSSSNSQPAPHDDCCGYSTGFCSPQSGTCYDSKGKDYYLECLPKRLFGTNVGDWEQLAGEACSESDQSELIYDVPSREECRNYCKDRSHPWCRTFQFSAASSSCGSRSMCRLLGNCLNMLEPWRWCLLGLLLYRLISTECWSGCRVLTCPGLEGTMFGHFMLALFSSL